MSEETLLGTTGLDRGIRRIGQTVRRPRHAQSDYVAALLLHLERVGFSGAPRYLGVDEQGRDVLSYVAGEVGDPERELPLPALESAARLVRRFHDATVGTELAGDKEVASHPDLGPYNIVFSGLEAVALIDWDDGVKPGWRLRDLGHLAWAAVAVGVGGGELEHQAARLAATVQAYCPDELYSVAEVVDEVKARMIRGRDWHVREGHPQGVAVFQAEIDWHRQHGGALKRLASAASLQARC